MATKNGQLARIAVILLFIFQSFIVFSQGIGINETGSTPDASAAVDIVSTNKGMLLPRMTTIQRNNISSPATGLIIYNTDNDCIQFWAQGVWNNISCAASSCPTWSDDFSGTDDWTDTGTLINVNTGTDVIDWDANITNANHGTSIAQASDNSSWILRFQLTIDNFTSGSSGNSCELFVGLSDTDGSSDLADNQDGIGILLRINSNTSLNKWYTAFSDGAGLTNGVSTFTHNPTTETLYIEVIRVSATSAKFTLYSDASYSTVVESITETIPSGIVGMGNIKVVNMNSAVTNDHTINGTIGIVEFCNGQTSW